MAVELATSPLGVKYVPIETDREKEIVAETFKDQDKFFTAVCSGLYKWLLFAGDIRSGKTIICLLIFVFFCRVYPKSRWIVIRKDIPTLRRTTIPTFLKYCCPSNFLAFYNKSDFIATFRNGSQILFMGESIKDDPQLNRFLGLECNGFLFDQIEECQEKTFNICKSRCGQWKIEPMPPQIILATANPNAGWIKEKWYDAWVAGILKKWYYFQNANILDNPHITEEFINTLLEDWPSELVERFLKQNWEAADELGQLVSWEVINKCKERVDTKVITKYMGVDVGRDGPDPSVWFIMRGNNVEKIIKIDKTKIDEVVDKTEQIMLEEGIRSENVCVDCVGLGSGVGDYLVRHKHNVIHFIGGTPCNQYLTGTDFKFGNYRSWACWSAAQEMKNGHVGNFVDKRLRSDTGAIKYEIRNDKEIYIQSKEQFKKLTGRSSDYWDAYYMCIWAKIFRTLIPTPGVFGV